MIATNHGIQFEQRRSVGWIIEIERAMLQLIT